MKTKPHLHPALGLALVPIFLTSCEPGRAPQPNPNQTKAIDAVHVNPYKAGTYAHFTASKNYPKTYGIYRNEALLAKTNGSNAKVIVDRKLQRAFLLNNGEVAMDYPVSTGNKSFPTPAGKYQVLRKTKANKRSNLYGKIYDAEGKVVNSNADISKDPVPEGGRFEGALMSYWMRISWDGIGMHKGKVPRYPASHGCIRTYYKAVDTVYSKVAVGTPVVVR
ncbi:L,D-transpeptidase [Rubritalea tangerina]|uniref:L,D-transpeptidase n=2 Tax=Rubritalea tangerina TaxID=430798 RepID=A0ABW4Z713_9BACT